MYVVRTKLVFWFLFGIYTVLKQYEYILRVDLVGITGHYLWIIDLSLSFSLSQMQMFSLCKFASL